MSENSTALSPRADPAPGRASGTSWLSVDYESRTLLSRVALRGRRRLRPEGHLVSLVHSGEYSTVEVAELFGVG